MIVPLEVKSLYSLQNVAHEVWHRIHVTNNRGKKLSLKIPLTCMICPSSLVVSFADAIVQVERSIYILAAFFLPPPFLFLFLVHFLYHDMFNHTHCHACKISWEKHCKRAR